ncbi:hypothetical protein LAZ67_5001239 [Cordylochernes scorpioides]|uniref:Transposable element Tc1 transposase n=1 Tax=Cordylochernes scorpioides TaxID=51811 RepID=A0ABY6KGH4_9ARAC|nr:hypothetical protein LAZ67_5001239 [Cordylochernes scorpioides]
MPGHRKRRQFKQTDAFTRGMVIGLKRAGWSIRQIAADTHLGASTVHRLWRRWLEQGNVAIYRNAGATRVTSARVDRRILRQAVAAPQATCTAILQHVQDTLDHSISTRTISRRLVANGLHSCRPLRRLPLTPPNRRQRLEWCRARSTWMTKWHRVVFSDESRFCLSSDSRRVRVWRRRGERSNPAAIVERPTGTMTAQRYVDDVLRPVILPYLQGVPNALYQQDNARPHTARISQQALQDVQMLPWPPYSPDLSPIEHVWDIIGRRLHALPQPRSKEELWQMVEREWRAIPQDAIRTLIDSLPRRVAACIAVREDGKAVSGSDRAVLGPTSATSVDVVIAGDGQAGQDGELHHGEDQLPPFGHPEGIRGLCDGGPWGRGGPTDRHGSDEAHRSEQQEGGERRHGSSTKLSARDRSFKKQRFQRLQFVIMCPSPYRATIAHLTDEDICTSDITRRLKINARIVKRIVKQYRERGHYGVLPNSSRPRTVNTSATRNIIKRGLPEMMGYRLYRGQTFSEATMNNRLNKANKLLSMIRVGRLSDIVWTDEKIFTVEVVHNSQNHRQLLPPGNVVTHEAQVPEIFHEDGKAVSGSDRAVLGPTSATSVDLVVAGDGQAGQDGELHHGEDQLPPFGHPEGIRGLCDGGPWGRGGPTNRHGNDEAVSSRKVVNADMAIQRSYQQEIVASSGRQLILYSIVELHGLS